MYMSRGASVAVSAVRSQKTYDLSRF